MSDTSYSSGTAVVERPIDRLLDSLRNGSFADVTFVVGSGDEKCNIPAIKAGDLGEHHSL